MGVLSGGWGRWIASGQERGRTERVGFPGRKNERLILFFLSRLFEADPHSLIIHALQLIFGQCVTPFCRSRGMHRVGGGIFACISFWDVVLFDCYWFHNFIYWSVAGP
jgi:hypothetical protein